MQRLKEFRVKNRLRLTEIAHFSKVSPSYLSQLEHDKAILSNTAGLSLVNGYKLLGFDVKGIVDEILKDAETKRSGFKRETTKLTLEQFWLAAKEIFDVDCQRDELELFATKMGFRAHV